MMATHTLKLSSHAVRIKACNWVNAAPETCVVTFNPEPKRSTVQNAKMWAMLGDISRQVEHNGRKHTPETWKLLHLHALGHESRFEVGLNGEVFPVGLRSSALSVGEMADLIEWMYKWGAENGVLWSENGF